MARGRMINKRLGKSKKFAKLKSDKSRVLYVLIYAHTDCEGRFFGDPEEIKIECCPYLKYSIKKIAESVIELDDVDLINLYEVNDKPYIEFVNFKENQPGLRKDRESPSIIPTPTQLQHNSDTTPSLYLSLSLNKSKVSKEGSKEGDKEIYFDYDDGEFHNISEQDKQIWQDAYPKCDIELELKKMVAWLLADSARKKKQYKRFINGWLCKCQDKGGTKGVSQQGETWLDKKLKEQKEAVETIKGG